MSRAAYIQEDLKKQTKILAGVDIPVHTEGFSPRVTYDIATKKPSAVYIPEIPEEADDDLIAAMHGIIDHECGHILASSADDICDSTKSKLWHYIHNCIEDPRVNAWMADTFLGCEANITRSYEYLFKKTDKEGNLPYSKECVEAINVSDATALKDAQVRYSCVWFAYKANCRFHGTPYQEMGLDRLYGPLEAKMDPIKVEALQRLGTADDVRDLTDYFEQFFFKEFDEGAGGEGDAKPGEGRLEGAKKLEEQIAEEIEQELAGFAAKKGLPFHYTDRFDKIFDREDIHYENKKCVDEGKVAQFENRVREVSNYLNKDLRRMLESRNRTYWVGGQRSGKLHQPSLSSVRFGNDRIFSKRSEVRNVKAAVSLLIDMSGSMEGDDKIAVAMLSAYAFAMTLEQLKVPYEVWGFTTSGHSPAKALEFEKFEKDNPETAGLAIAPTTYEKLYAFKQFHETMDYRTKFSMVAAAEGYIDLLDNEDSLHVKKALERLSVRPEEKRSLFIFSDGRPWHTSSEQSELTTRMLRRLDKASDKNYGTSIFAIGIKDRAVASIYKRHAIVNDLEDLPEALFGFLRQRI